VNTTDSPAVARLRKNLRYASDFPSGHVEEVEAVLAELDRLRATDGVVRRPSERPARGASMPWWFAAPTPIWRPNELPYWPVSTAVRTWTARITAPMWRGSTTWHGC
jgi:hypothetical protein